MNPLDGAMADLDQIDMDLKALACIERDLAIRPEGEIGSTGRNALPDINKDAGRCSEVHVFGLENRRVNHAGCTANEDELTAQLRPDTAGGCAESLDECFSHRGSDDRVRLRHVSEVRDERGCAGSS